MEVFLEGQPWHQRWFYKVASESLYPTIVSAIGFAYIGSPSSLQESFRRFIPLEFRKFMLEQLTIESWLIILLAISIICAIWGGAGSNLTVWLVKKKHKKVLEDLEQLKQDKVSKSINCYGLFSKYLYNYYERLGLTVNERVSLYKLDMGAFSCIGRHSDDEIFNRTPSRLYEQTEGCISKAWQVGSVEDANSPDPNESIDNWIAYHVDNFNFSEDTLRNINMKSRSFYGFRIRNMQNETIAVMMFESINIDGLPFGKLNRMFVESEKKNIAHLLVSLNSHMPSLDLARTEGF